MLQESCKVSSTSRNSDAHYNYWCEIVRRNSIDLGLLFQSVHCIDIPITPMSSLGTRRAFRIHRSPSFHHCTVTFDKTRFIYTAFEVTANWTCRDIIGLSALLPPDFLHGNLKIKILPFFQCLAFWQDIIEMFILVTVIALVCVLEKYYRKQNECYFGNSIYSGSNQSLC